MENQPMSAIPRPRPQLVVIGDSLAQGCRSLTVNADYCAQSWPARIAQEQAWDFVTPDFPRPVLFDLEEEVRSLPHLTLSLVNLRFEGFFQRVRENLRAWLKNDRESDASCFDNLALSAAKINDLYTRSAASSNDKIASLVPMDDPDPAGTLTDLELVQKLADLHLPINARFTLNPSQDPAFANFTPLDWVRERKPHVLVVQIGHNHGLYQIGEDAATDVSFDQGDYWDEWQELATRLAQLPAEIETILVALLPKVGAVANLHPQDDDRRDGYADAYSPTFSVSPSVLAGTDLASIDGKIHTGNARIQTILKDAHTAAGAPNRLKFLDSYSLFESYDYKNSLDDSRQIVINDELWIDNRYVTGTVPRSLPLRVELATGGFQSIDGMHPSGCGYAMLASEAMKLLNLPQQREALLERGYDDDTLLAQYPLALDTLIALLKQVRALRRLGAKVPIPEGLLADRQHLTDLLPRLQRIFSS
jgi:hypothetical protein